MTRTDTDTDIWSPKPRSFHFHSGIERATAVIMAARDCPAKIAREIAHLARRLAPFGEWSVARGRIYTSDLEIEIRCRHELDPGREEFEFAFAYDRTWEVKVKVNRNQ